jgi:hypothetical protein
MVGMEKLKSVVREQNVVELKPWESVHAAIKEPMVTGLVSLDVPDNLLAMGFARITKPVIIGEPAPKNSIDRWTYLIGEAANFVDCDAGIEMTLGDKIIKINYPYCVFVSKNPMHCPLDVKRVGKPFVFIDARITKESSVRPKKLAKIRGVKYTGK